MQQYITAQNGDRQIVPTTDQELLELYEQRYKPALLAAAEATAEAHASTNYSYLLDSEGLSALTDEDLIAYSDHGERPLYLGTPARAGDAEGIDLAASSGNGAEEISDTAEAAANDEQPASCTVPSATDRELLDSLRERGHAATVSEVAQHAGADMDVLGNATLAHYRHHRGRVLLATSAANDEDLDRAANRAAAEAIEHTFERSVRHVSVVASILVQRLTNLGGSGSLEEAKRHLAAAGSNHLAIRPVIGELHRRGLVRISVRGAAPESGERDRVRDQRQRYITLADAAEGSLAMAAGRYNEDLGKIPARRAEARDLAIKRGQDKAFAAPFVPFGGTPVGPAEQSRALYIERAKERYAEASLRGVGKVTLSLPATEALPAQEVTLYSAAGDEAGSFTEFFREKIKARILTGLSRNGHLTQRRIISALFPERSSEILSFLSEGRTMSPQLSEPYEMFRAAARELIEEGKARHTRKGFVLAEPDSERLPATSEVTAEVTEWADEDPEPEQQSGPDPYGSDRYAADMAGAHDHRRLASGPQAPVRRPAQREKAARRISGAISRARAAKDVQACAEAANRKAMANAAWREALSQHMVALEAEERLELHLQLEGEQRLQRMVEAAEEPAELYRGAIVLKDEGRISVRTEGGYTLISANAELDRTELSRTLVAVMAAGHIPVPEGTSLATRVAALADRPAA